MDRLNADALYRRPFQSIDGVVQKVQQDLLELIFVKRYGRQIGFDLNLDLNVMIAQMVFAQRQDVLQQHVQVGAFLFRTVLPREAEQVLDDAAHPVGFADKLVQFLPRRSAGDLVAQQFGISHHGSQRIVQLMGYAGHKLSHGRQFFRSRQLPVQGAVVDGYSQIVGQQLDLRHLFSAHAGDVAGIVQRNPAYARAARGLQRHHQLISCFPEGIGGKGFLAAHRPVRTRLGRLQQIRVLSHTGADAANLLEIHDLVFAGALPELLYRFVVKPAASGKVEAVVVRAQRDACAAEGAGLSDGVGDLAA